MLATTTHTPPTQTVFRIAELKNNLLHKLLITPCKVSSDCSWTGLYIISIQKKIETQKIEVHFNTGRLPFEFNGLQYRFAAGQFFVALANPVSVSFG